ncbi:MAG: VacJ family lipoprotein [Piscirickettsiaceae bacterium]|nr:VacJ family lipoprotein [Piscirickettsiaceae bacterium]
MSNITTLFKISIVTATLFLTGCATTQHQSNVNDPLEGYNRVMHSFNDTVDKAVIKPIAQGYDFIMPAPISTGVSNFFSNLNEITVIANDVLQFKFTQAFDDTSRFAINSTLGIVGFMDVASDFGYRKNNEDFGQTLGSWGIGPGPYLVLPFLGPRDIRDTVGLVGDYYTDPMTYVKPSGTRDPARILWVVDGRANLLKAEKVLEEAAIDEYVYVRDAYLQRRQSLVYDGNPPEEEFDVFAD